MGSGVLDDWDSDTEASGSLNAGKAGGHAITKPTTADNSSDLLLELAESDPDACIARQVAIWEAQDPAIRALKPYWDRNRLWYRGIRGVRLRPLSRELYDTVELWVAPGAFDQPTVMNRVPDLIERLGAHMFQDPPVPCGEPTSDSDEDKNACEFAERLLTAIGSEGERNDQLFYRLSFAKSSIWTSVFSYQYIDPQGSAPQPVQIDAHPQAMQADTAHLAPDGSEYNGPWVQKFVGEDGSLSDEQPPQPKTQFGPKLCRKLLTPLSVRLIPDSAQSIADATGVQILSLTTVGQLKDQYPDDTASLTKEDWDAVVAWKPEAARWIAPGYLRRSKAWSSPMHDDMGMVDDSAVAVQLATIYKAHPRYPRGAYILSAGKTALLYAQPWQATYKGPDGADRTEDLELPVSQCRQLFDPDHDNPYGDCVVAHLGPIAEVKGSIVLGWLDHLDRFLHPIQWVPLGSNVQLDALAARDGSPQYFNAAGQPSTEAIPPFLPDGIQFYGMAESAENDITGLYAPAEGNAAPADSGVKVNAEIGQSMVNLSQIRQNLADYIERDWRIAMQLLRGFTPSSMRLKYVTDDGKYTEQAWCGADLQGVASMKVGLGSFTQRTPEQKQQLMNEWTQAGYISPMDAKDMIQSNVRATIALDDDPYMMKIKREIAAFKAGPPQNWPLQLQAYQAKVTAQATAQQQAAQLHQRVAAQSQALGTQPPPQVAPVPPLTGPFMQSPTDDQPDIAKMRFYMLGRLLASTAFSNAQDPQWKETAHAEFLRAKAASGAITLAEQMQSAQTQSQTAAALEAKTQSAIDTNKAQAEGQQKQAEIGAQTQKTTAEVLQELKSDIALMVLQAGLNAQVQAPPAAELEGGVEREAAQTLGVPVSAPVNTPLIPS